MTVMAIIWQKSELGEGGCLVTYIDCKNKTEARLSLVCDQHKYRVALLSHSLASPYSLALQISAFLKNKNKTSMCMFINLYAFTLHFCLRDGGCFHGYQVTSEILFLAIFCKCAGTGFFSAFSPGEENLTEY